MRSVSKAVAVVAICLPAFFGSGCGKGGGSPKSDAAADAASDAPTTPISTCVAPKGVRRANGQACGCGDDCQSGFCADGVCCNTACKETCMACNLPSSPGVCSFVPAGRPPQVASQCPAASEQSCGLDGTCNGSGGCRKHVPGTVCSPGTCSGAAVDGMNVCDGQGRCKPGAAVICAPFTCDASTGACITTCRSDTDCVSGVRCVNGSCGPKPRGAVCRAGSECASGFCADGVCCNVACNGACVSCNQTGRAGTCWPTEVGNRDPHGVCRDEGVQSCGQTGTCDGVGGCALYAAETVCRPPACSGGDRLETAGTCDGAGACRAPGLRTCNPFRCVEGACLARCATDGDCVGGRVCNSGSCGPKTNGQPCTAAAECASNFCVDGVCCGEACGGACRSCALPSALGQCTPVPAAADDPRDVCSDEGAASCGTDGRCDGAGGCRRYPPGTTCAPERCAAGVYTPPATCSASGACVAPDALACAPFTCNDSRCFTSCTVDANCAPGTVCNGNSCGKKPNGAFCEGGAECASGTCAQGVCCATACASACRSCALPGAMGICSNVADGQVDPTGTCTDQGAATCGTNGRCQGGACQRYPGGTTCRAASCPAGTTTFTMASVCDGAGTCVTPTASSCFPFRCGQAACRSSCTADADCAPPAVCAEGSCGLKPNGAACSSESECTSGFCARGICCNSACDGTCLSCAISGRAGTCSPVPAGGPDPQGGCAAQAASTCGRTGFCNGSGGCQLHPAGTECAGPSCPTGTTTASLARTCDGAGTCRPATTQSCAPYACNGATCNAACATEADCAPGTPCIGGSCGLRRLGQACGAGTECEGGNCVDGVCCSTASCGTCASCNVAGSAGSCRPVPAGSRDPHDRCTPSPPCGADGACDGNGACRAALAGTSCAPATCTGSTLTSGGACNGAGTCVQGTSSCSPYTCGTGACRTTCTADADCLSGFTCQSGSCTNLRPNGTLCTTGTECISGHCTEGVCCGAASCGSCRSCVVAGREGICAPVPAGAADPAAVCVDTGAAGCGTTGVCDGAGACATYPNGTPCAGAACQGESGRLTPASSCQGGVCTAGAVIDCVPYACDRAANVCKQSCTTDPDCGRRHRCELGTAGPGTCVPM